MEFSAHQPETDDDARPQASLPPMDCPVFQHSKNPWEEAAIALAETSHHGILPPPSCPAHDAFTTLRIASRKSILALIQANHTVSLLSKAHPGFTFPISTVVVKGDADKVTPFAKFSTTTTPDAAKSLWTKEIEDALLADQVDLIVHSLKDMPTMLPEGCLLGAVVEREDPRDALVMKAGSRYTSLADLPDGSVVGTSSVRRKAQLMHTYPQLVIQECRGNVDSRLAKLDAPDGKYSCLILATAGLERLNLSHRITSRLSTPGFLHAVGQGALGIEIRANDARTTSLIAPINHVPSRLCCLSERSLLRKLQGGCSAPIGVQSKFEQVPTYNQSEDNESTSKSLGMLYLSATVTSPDGKEEVYASAHLLVAGDADAEKLGIIVAEKLLTNGADKILAAIVECARFSIAYGSKPPASVTTKSP